MHYRGLCLSQLTSACCVPLPSDINHIVHWCVLHQPELGMGVQFTVVRRDVWGRYLYVWWLCWTSCSRAFLLYCILYSYCWCCCPIFSNYIKCVVIDWFHTLNMATEGSKSLNLNNSIAHQQDIGWKDVTNLHIPPHLVSTTIHIAMLIPYPTRHSGAFGTLMTKDTSLLLVDMLGYKKFNRQP